MTTTTNKSLNTPANGSYLNDWDVVTNGNFDIIDAALGGTTIINVTGVTGPYIGLNLTQYMNQIIYFEGTLTANLYYIIPAGVGGQWTVINATSPSAFFIAWNINGGTSVPATQGYGTICNSDGVNMRPSDNGTALLAANAAQAAAQSFATSAANTAQSNAETYAASQASAAQSNAEAYAASVANTAQSNAETYAASVANTAQSNAEGYAASVANTAQSNAETYAAAVATNAQNTAISVSESYANGLIQGGSNANGTYIKYPDGTIMQWGEIPTGYGNNYVQTYPVVFPNTCRNIQLTPVGQNSTFYTTQPGAANNAFGLFASDANTQFSWFAIGR